VPYSPHSSSLICLPHQYSMTTSNEVIDYAVFPMLLFSSYVIVSHFFFSTSVPRIHFTCVYSC
jgi:hypothetical protein